MTKDLKYQEDLLALPINKVDSNDTSKQNILMTISYLKTIAEFYKEKGLTFAETDIKRLDFLYHYFGVVDIQADTIYETSERGIDANYNNYTFLVKDTYGSLIKIILGYYNSYYYMIMKIIEIEEANGNKITIKNIGRENINLTEKSFDIYDVFVGDVSSVCQWSADSIKPNETASCVLEKPCTGKTVKVVTLSIAKEITCS